MTKPSLANVKSEVDLIRNEHPSLKQDSAFVFWFLRAFLTESDEDAFKALTGGSGDKSLDAVYLDERAKQAHIVQAKFHYPKSPQESRNDVLALADVAIIACLPVKEQQPYLRKLQPATTEKFSEMSKRLRERDYELRVHYVTTGRVSKAIRAEARDRVRKATVDTQFSVIDLDEVLTISRDYLDGIAPAVPTLSLRIGGETGIQSSGILFRYDPSLDIESWVFSMAAKDVGMLYGKAGVRLFARNIRGYLGEASPINHAMAHTIKHDPHKFWYYNNGVTIVCDNARRETDSGRDVLIVERPQVINGQQTTRTLETHYAGNAGVLVKVIRVPRVNKNDGSYDNLVSAIVRATNWQNAIKPADLVSNDFMQISLEREFRKLKYQYLRKRQTKSEARRFSPGYSSIAIKKEEGNVPRLVDIQAMRA